MVAFSVSMENFYSFDKSDDGALDETEYDDWVDEARGILDALDLGTSHRPNEQAQLVAVQVTVIAVQTV